MASEHAPIEGLEEDMIDRAIAEAVTYRVAVAALTYYPDKEATQPGYTVADDVAWCVEPLDGALSATGMSALTETVAATIGDPTSHRARLTEALAAISE